MKTDKYARQKDEFLLECDCHCGVLGFYNDEEMYISYFESSFYAQQKPFLTEIKERIKMICCALFSKRYRLYDIVIPKERIEEFKEWVSKI